MSWVTQAYYLVVILSCYLVFDFLSGGLIKNILLVRMSRGKKILVHVYGLEGWYWTNGELNDNHLRYKTKEGDKKSLTIQDEKYIGREYNLPVVVVDAVKNAVWKPRLSGVEGFDAKAMDNVIKQALNKPNISDEKVLKAILLGVIVTAVISGYVAYKFFAIPGMLEQIMEAIRSIGTV